MESNIDQNSTSQDQDTYWRSLSIFNFYRFILAAIFIGSFYFRKEHYGADIFNPSLYISLSLGYLLSSVILLFCIRIRWPNFNRLVTLQIMNDIIFIVLIMSASGGVKSGFGVMLVITIAAASLISQGRLALFYAAIASIALLLEQSYQMIMFNGNYDDYSQIVMLSLSCFATAWLAHSFAKRTKFSETIASQREVDLANSNQINELITQEMTDGVLVVDKKNHVRHHNSVAEALLNIDPASWEKVLISEISPEISFLMENWVTQHDDSDSGFSKLTIADRDLKLRFMPIGALRSQGVVIFIEDWSQMQAQAQQQKLAALGQLTANMAHEIRNPLSAISHASQLLQEEVTDKSAQRMLQIISDNVQRLDQMVKDVLELNRRDRTNQESINLIDFLTEFHEYFCSVEKIPLNAFLLKIESNELKIKFDKRHLHQILWNLCRNGWRHSQQTEGSLIMNIRSSSRSRYINIDINDDGPGVSQEIKPRLFEPFFTTESTGTGLGLYIARELCEANGSHIKYITSNRGGLFSIQLKKLVI